MASKDGVLKALKSYADNRNSGIGDKNEASVYESLIRALKGAGASPYDIALLNAFNDTIDQCGSLRNLT